MLGIELLDALPFFPCLFILLSSSLSPPFSPPPLLPLPSPLPSPLLSPLPPLTSLLSPPHFSNHLFLNHPEYGVGELTKERQKLVKNAYLIKIADRLGLSRYLIKDARVEFGGDSMCRLLSNCVEAIIGAVFLDRGLEEADKLFARMSFPREVSWGLC